MGRLDRVADAVRQHGKSMSELEYRERHHKQQPNKKISQHLLEQERNASHTVISRVYYLCLSHTFNCNEAQADVSCMNALAL